MEPGDYEPRVVEAGVEETTLDVKEGEVYWLVQLEDGGQMDVEKQVDAEILSRLVIVEHKIDNMNIKVDLLLETK